ncbi:MAG TPA: DUF6161 domain-containing protein [Verrucomicrobiae bacterium]|jgi:hypothetical protein
MRNETIEVTLGSEAGQKVFATFQELEDWLGKERTFWTWFTSPPWTNAKQVMQQSWLDEFFRNVQASLNQIKNPNADPNQLPSGIAGIKSQFSQFYGQRLGIYSGSPKGLFLEQLRNDEGDAIAAGAVVFFAKRTANLNESDNFNGALAGYCFNVGISSRKPSEIQSLETLRVEWEQKFQTFRTSLISETETHKQLNTDGANQLQKQDTEFKELVANSKKHWTDLNKTYDDLLALRSPVTYWTRKAKTHLWLSWAYAVVSLIAAGTSLVFLIPEVKSMMEIPKGIQEPDKWHPEYWRIAVLIASGLFCVWVVRILVRLLLSNIHLLTDARERVTMVQTYLALMRRGKLKDDERMFILQTLFRPTPTGIVKDDAVPLTIIESITKLGK